MEWNKFSQFFHPSWERKLKPWIESRNCNEVYAFLRQCNKEGGNVSPSSDCVYKAFLETSYEDLKLIIIGDSPYTFQMNDGLLLGCSKTGIVSRELNAFYRLIEDDLHNGLNLSYNKNPDVSYLSKQGVLMLPIALTTNGVKGDHIELWKSFINYLFLNVFQINVPILLYGEETKHLCGYIVNTFYAVPKEPTKVFTEINKILMNNNGDKLNWLDEPPF
jgi:uracil-DNA glycosylase